jgi:hypothetical protein
MLEQQVFQFAGESSAPKRVGSRFGEYARLLAIFLKFYFQARVLMVQNWMLAWRLQLLELPLVYLKFEIFLIRLSQGFPIGECWPGQKSSL